MESASSDLQWTHTHTKEHTHTYTHKNTHTHTYTHTKEHTHTHTHTTHTLKYLGLLHPVGPTVAVILEHKKED